MSIYDREVKVFTEATADVGTTAEDVGDAIVLHHTFNGLFFYVTNTGNTLAELALLVQAVSGGAWHTLLEGSDWADTSIYSMRYSSGSGSNAIDVLATTETGVAWVSLPPCYAIKFQAASSTGTTAVTVKGRVTHDSV